MTTQDLSLLIGSYKNCDTCCQAALNYTGIFENQVSKNRSSNIGKITTTNQCKRVPDLCRPGEGKIKRYYAKNGRLIPTAKRGKEILYTSYIQLDKLNFQIYNLNYHLYVVLLQLFNLTECKKCTKQYIGETKRQLHERFGEHRRSIQNHHQLIKPTPVSTHFNQPGHFIDHLLLTPLELIHDKRDSVRKSRAAHRINKAMTLEPLGNQWTR